MLRTRLRGPSLALETCARRLQPHAVTFVGGRDRAEVVLEWRGGADDLGHADIGPDADISWYGPAGFSEDRPASEATIQALCGLMHLHDGDSGGPRRLGLEVASVAAGVLAAQGLLAARIGALRGQALSGVQTSVLQAGLLLVSHYVAAATCAEPWEPAPPGSDPGPPFRSAEGRWFEIETLEPEAWKSFWERLGAAGAELGRAWALFRPRYYRATCSLPPGLHQATAAQPLDVIMEVAADCGVSVSPLRGYDEVLGEPGASAHLPVIDPGPPPSGPGGRGSAPPAGSLLGPEGNLPLRGLRVIEATTRLQGPLAGLLLQMLGAHVVKVEPPGGDFGRIVPPVAGDTGSFFLCFNRGKEVVELDLSRASGRDGLVELVADADVFLHNWRPGKAKAWGLDAHDLLAVNPHLIHTTASGWGDRPIPLLGTDFLVQAYAGLGQGLNPQGTPPVPSRVILVDYFGALITCEGILGGLYQRELSRRGARVGTSLLAGAMALQAHVLDAIVRGTEDGRSGGRPVWGPLDHPLAVDDGFVVVSVDDPAAFRRLCGLCGVDVTGSSPAQAELEVVRCMCTRSGEHWQRQLATEGIACEVVPGQLDLGSLPSDSRLSSLFEPLAETSQAPRPPWRFWA